MKKLTERWRRFCASIYAGITVVLMWCGAITWTLVELTRLG